MSLPSLGAGGCGSLSTRADTPAVGAYSDPSGGYTAAGALDHSVVTARRRTHPYR